MSSSGLYFETMASFEMGQAAELLITLEHVDPGRPVEVVCKGRVCRIEESRSPPGDPALRGVAVAVSEYGFDVSSLDPA